MDRPTYVRKDPVMEMRELPFPGETSETVRLVRIRNPWGNDLEWKVKWTRRQLLTSVRRFPFFFAFLAVFIVFGRFWKIT